MTAHDAQRTRKVILNSAFTEIHRNGFRATSLDSILHKTGLTKGAFYHHFTNKQALGYAILDELLPALLQEYWLKRLADSADPIAGLQELLRTFKTEDEFVALGCPLANLAVEMAGVDQGFHERVHGLFCVWGDAIAAALQKGQQAGLVNAQLDAQAVGLFIVAAMTGCRAVAKGAQDRRTLLACHEQLARYLETLRPQ